MRKFAVMHVTRAKSSNPQQTGLRFFQGFGIPIAECTAEAREWHRKRRPFISGFFARGPCRKSGDWSARLTFQKTAGGTPGFRKVTGNHRTRRSSAKKLV